MMIRIVDVSPRDGLQNEPNVLSPEMRADLVRQLVGAGLPQVEVGSFVRADRVPQMADVEAVISRLPGPASSARFTALVPNEHGYIRAVGTGLRHVRAVVAASDEMNRRNFRVDTARMLDEIGRILTHASAEEITASAVIATAFGCPYQGRVDPKVVAEIATRLARQGAGEVILADTTGMAVPPQVRALVGMVTEAVAPAPVGVHLHNTRNTGYANAYAAIEAGAVILDAALGGIGGCPFAPRATGNIATEDLVHMLERSGIKTGVDVDRLLDAVRWLEQALNHPVPGLLEKAGQVAEAAHAG